MVDLAGLYPIDSVSISNRWCGSPSDPKRVITTLLIYRITRQNSQRLTSWDNAYKWWVRISWEVDH
jgi:hypothetical protein